ncbi:hypothetical protein ABEF93_003305 [Exophiala dermatitidis]
MTTSVAEPKSATHEDDATTWASVIDPELLDTGSAPIDIPRPRTPFRATEMIQWEHIYPNSWETSSSTSTERQTVIWHGEKEATEDVDVAKSPETKSANIDYLFESEDDKRHTSKKSYRAPPDVEYIPLSPERTSPWDLGQDLWRRNQPKFPIEPDLPAVVIDEYLPGQNDLMSGAVDPRDDNVTLMAFPEDSVTSDFEDNLAAGLFRMPFKIINRRDIRRLDLPFDDPHSLRVLPPDFLTTYLGLSRAIEEVCGRGSWTDEKLIDAIAKRGGMSGKRVVYPEDIVPYVRKGEIKPDSGDDESDDGGKGDPYDKEYWKEMQLQGEIWDEIEVP